MMHRKCRQSHECWLCGLYKILLTKHTAISAGGSYAADSVGTIPHISFYCTFDQILTNFFDLQICLAKCNLKDGFLWPDGGETIKLLQCWNAAQAIVREQTLWPGFHRGYKPVFPSRSQWTWGPPRLGCTHTGSIGTLHHCSCWPNSSPHLPSPSAFWRIVSSSRRISSLNSALIWGGSARGAWGVPRPPVRLQQAPLQICCHSSTCVSAANRTEDRMPYLDYSEFLSDQ